MPCGLGNSPACTAWHRSMQGRGRGHGVAVWHPAAAVRSASGTSRLLALQTGSPPPLSSSMRPIGKVTGGPFDHCELVDGLNIGTNSSGLISTPRVARCLIMIGIPIASLILRKCLTISPSKAFRTPRPTCRTRACVTVHAEKRAASPHSETHGQPAARSASEIRAMTIAGRNRSRLLLTRMIIQPRAASSA